MGEKAEMLISRELGSVALPAFRSLGNRLLLQIPCKRIILQKLFSSNHKSIHFWFL